MSPTEQELTDFAAAVEANVETVERLISYMSTCPYTERNDLIATLAGFIEDTRVVDDRKFTMGVTAIIMLMLERKQKIT